MADRASTDSLLELISRSLFNALLRAADQWAQLEVTLPQLKVLLLLGLHGSSPVSTLAQQMRVSPPNVTGILDRLEAHGWVRRTSDPQDRRVVRVVLTGAGERLLASLDDAGRSRTRARLDQMEHADRRALAQGLRALLGTGPLAVEPERAFAGSFR